VIKKDMVLEGLVAEDCDHDDYEIHAYGHAYIDLFLW
jgi:hypothetical protein